MISDVEEAFAASQKIGAALSSDLPRHIGMSGQRPTASRLQGVAATAMVVLHRLWHNHDHRAASSAAFIEIVRIDLLYRVKRNGRYANVMVDHQLGQLFAINQD